MYNADGLYSLLTTSDLIAFYSFVEGEFLKEKDSIEEFKEKNKNLRYYTLSYLVQKINKSFKDENICYLDFNSLSFNVNPINFELFITFIKKNASIEELDLSKSIISEDNMLSILDAVEKKESFFTLNLSEVDITQKIVVVVTQIIKNDPKKKIKISKKYTGISKSVLNSQIKNKKYKH